MLLHNKRVIGIVATVGFLLLIPLIAMQFTDQVNWTLADFLIAAVFLLATGFAGEWVLRKVKDNNRRIAILLGILVVFLLIWAELAVGIFGTPLAGS